MVERGIRDERCVDTGLPDERRCATSKLPLGTALRERVNAEQTLPPMCNIMPGKRRIRCAGQTTGYGRDGDVIRQQSDSDLRMAEVRQSEHTAAQEDCQHRTVV